MLTRPALRAAIRPFVAIAATLWCLAAVVTAQAELVPKRPFFWCIERADGSGKPSWLLGTFHVGDPRITTMHPETERALAAADAVFTELPMESTLMGEVMKRSTLPKGQRLSTVLPPELWERLQRRLADPPAARLGMERLQPWAVAVWLMMADTGSTGEAYDMQVYKDAKAADKEVGGLETIDEQMHVFESLGIDGGIAYLRQTMDVLDRYRAEGRDYLEEMIRAYAAGDGAALVRFFDESMAMDRVLWTGLMQALLTDRNLRMVDRMAAKLRATPERSFVFAVGAGHCVGIDNLVDLLRDRGYVVRRVPEHPDDLDAEIAGTQARIEALQRRLDALRARRAVVEKPVRKAG